MPFSENAIAMIGVVADGAGNVCASADVLKSYSFTEPSMPPTASRCPSGWNATVVSSVNRQLFAVSGPVSSRDHLPTSPNTCVSTCMVLTS